MPFTNAEHRVHYAVKHNKVFLLDPQLRQQDKEEKLRATNEKRNLNKRAKRRLAKAEALIEARLETMSSTPKKNRATTEEEEGDRTVQLAKVLQSAQKTEIDGYENTRDTTNEKIKKSGDSFREAFAMVLQSAEKKNTEEEEAEDSKPAAKPTAKKAAKKLVFHDSSGSDDEEEDDVLVVEAKSGRKSGRAKAAATPAKSPARAPKSKGASKSTPSKKAATKTAAARATPVSRATRSSAKKKADTSSAPSSSKKKAKTTTPAKTLITHDDQGADWVEDVWEAEEDSLLWLSYCLWHQAHGDLKKVDDSVIEAFATRFKKGSLANTRSFMHVQALKVWEHQDKKRPFIED